MSDHDTRRLILSARAAVLLPALWSSITGGLTGAFTALLLAALGKDNPQTGGLLVGTGAAIVAWTVAMIWWVRQWRRVRSPHTPEPVPPAPKTRIEIHQDNNRVIRFDDLPIDWQGLQTFCGWVRDGKTPNYADLSSLFGGNRQQTNAFRDALIEKGYMAWRHPDAHSQGIVITPAGKRLLPHLGRMAAENSDISRVTRAHAREDGEDE